MCSALCQVPYQLTIMSCERDIATQGVEATPCRRPPRRASAEQVNIGLDDGRRVDQPEPGHPEDAVRRVCGEVAPYVRFDETCGALGGARGGERRPGFRIV